MTILLITQRPRTSQATMAQPIPTPLVGMVTKTTLVQPMLALTQATWPTRWTLESTVTEMVATIPHLPMVTLPREASTPHKHTQARQMPDHTRATWPTRPTQESTATETTETTPHQHTALPLVAVHTLVRQPQDRPMPAHTAPTSLTRLTLESTLTSTVSSKNKVDV